jgi:stage V sporulation protein AE
MDKFIYAFLVGGTICALAQLLMDLARLTPAHTMCILVVAGVVLGGLGWY